MTRRVLVLMSLAGLARADSAEEARDVVRRMAQALGDGRAAEAVSVLDPSMPGYAQLRGWMTSLLSHAELQSTIEIRSNTGDDRSRTLKLNWRLHLVEREGPRATTERAAEVTCKLEKRDGHWLIVGLEPPNLFVPLRGAETWDLVQSAARALSVGNAAEFLALFDRGMPGYDALRTAVTALAETSEVESSVELVSNEGDDWARSLEVDWTLEMVNPDTGIRMAEREERVKCRVEWRNQHWWITRLEPLEFFRPAG